VATQIAWEPQILSLKVEVSVNEAIVTLAGSVESCNEKIIAERAAASVRGVLKVIDRLEVTAEGQLPDTEIVRSAFRALKTLMVIPEKRLEISSQGGLVTLTGTVEWQFQRTAAAACVSRVDGVREVHDRLQVRKMNLFCLL
jgi:osmotically-inducible protein OsmY